MAKYVMNKYVQSDMEIIAPGQRIPITFEVWDVHVSRDGSKKYGIRCSDLFEDVTISVSDRDLFKLMEVEIEGWFDKEDEKAFRMAIEALKDEWIPVTESLPEDGRDVLVYLSSKRMTIACYNSHKLPFKENAIGWGYRPLQGEIDFGNECVIAWRPLPDPYKKSEEE